MKLNIFNKKEYNSKLKVSKELIKLWVDFSGSSEKTYISFSGGKDSLVLLHLVRSIYPEITALFCNTLIEFPEVYQFVRTIPNVVWVKPTKTFQKVITENGWPVISKEQSKFIEELRRWPTENMWKRTYIGNSKSHTLSKKYRYMLQATFKVSPNCCLYLKKRPAKKYEKETKKKFPFIGIRASESNMRSAILSCNDYKSKRPKSMPLLKWNDCDIWHYIKSNHLKYCSLYDLGWKRIGCMYCLFGITLEKSPNRIQRMAGTHPKQYKYFMEKLKGKEVLDYMSINYKPYTGPAPFFPNLKG